jgi:hypothetical protein
MDGGLRRCAAACAFPGTEHLYAGLTYQFLQSTLTFKASEISTELPDVPASFHSAALGRSSPGQPRQQLLPDAASTRGVSWLNYGKRWGGDFEFDKVDSFYNHYLPFGVDVAARLSRALPGGERGHAVLRPADARHAGLFRRPLSRQPHALGHARSGATSSRSRWGIVAYAEAGRFASTATKLADGRTIKTVGGGVRWRVTAERDMNVGLDYAVSSDDRAVIHPDRERFWIAGAAGCSPHLLTPGRRSKVALTGPPAARGALEAHRQLTAKPETLLPKR